MYAAELIITALAWPVGLTVSMGIVAAVLTLIDRKHQVRRLHHQRKHHAH